MRRRFRAVKAWTDERTHSARRERESTREAPVRVRDGRRAGEAQPALGNVSSQEAARLSGPASTGGHPIHTPQRRGGKSLRRSVKHPRPRSDWRRSSRRGHLLRSAGVCDPLQRPATPRRSFHLWQSRPSQTREPRSREPIHRESRTARGGRATRGGSRPASRSRADSRRRPRRHDAALSEGLGSRRTNALGRLRQRQGGCNQIATAPRMQKEPGTGDGVGAIRSSGGDQPHSDSWTPGRRPTPPPARAQTQGLTEARGTGAPGSRGRRC